MGQRWCAGVPLVCSVVSTTPPPPLSSSPSPSTSSSTLPSPPPSPAPPQVALSLSLGEGLAHRMRCHLFSALLSRRPAFFDTVKTGQMVAWLGQDVEVLQVRWRWRGGQVGGGRGAAGGGGRGKQATSEDVF